MLLLGVAAVVFLLKAGDLFGWALARFETEISRALPDEMTQEERQRLHQAFQEAADAVRSGEFDPVALQRLQGTLRDSLLDQDQRLTLEQVYELIEVLEEVSGREPEAEPSSDDEAIAAVAARRGG
jgi:hypothetical protein